MSAAHLTRGADAALTAAERRAWQQDGFFVRRAQFDAAEIAAFAAAAERGAATALRRCGGGRGYVLDGKRFVDIDHITVQFEPAPGSTAIKVIEPVSDVEPALHRLAFDARLAEPMRGLLGERNIAMWTDKLNLKRPRDGSGFRWHQDSPYWIHACAHVDRLPNVMVSFDAADRHNGCLRVIRASHRTGRLPGVSDGSLLGGFYTDPAAFDPTDAAALEVPAGSLVFFSPHLVHGSEPNNSDQPRRAMVLTYQPAGQPMLKSGRVRNVPA